MLAEAGRLEGPARERVGAVAVDKSTDAAPLVGWSQRAGADRRCALHRHLLVAWRVIADCCLNLCTR